MCPEMRRYGPTVQVKDRQRLDSMCSLDGDVGAHCVNK